MKASKILLWFEKNYKESYATEIIDLLTYNTIHSVCTYDNLYEGCMEIMKGSDIHSQGHNLKWHLSLLTELCNKGSSAKKSGVAINKGIISSKELLKKHFPEK